MKTKFLLLVILIGTAMACSKNDGGQESETQNKPPETFSLLQVDDNSINVEVKPTFTWEQASDPNGDAVRYDLYLDTDSEPVTIVASGLSETTFSYPVRLTMAEDYYWKVVASDGKGGVTTSATNIFSTRNVTDGTEAVRNAAFSNRLGHTSVIFADKLWVIGGFGTNLLGYNDVWQSNLGANWSEVTDSAQFIPRSLHTSVVFDNKIWIIGGVRIGSDFNDVWYSMDGFNWIEATANADFPRRSEHTSVAFDNKIWVIAGFDRKTFKNKNDVWYSQNGESWTEATSSAGFSPRHGQTSVIFDDMIWIIGGTDEDGYKNDVWYSQDGENWEQATPSAHFSPRTNHASVVFDNKMWVIGGFGRNDETNDIWYSKEGANWVKASGSAAFSPRAYHSSVVFNEKIWIIGGSEFLVDDFKNDVWFLE